MLCMLKKRLGTEAIENIWLMNKNINDYFKIPSTLNIPEGCVIIGAFVFWCCRELREVTIPKSVKKIGDSAFRGCRNLREAIIPEGVKEIGISTFAGCKKLERVEIPESCEKIGNYAFENCQEATIILKKHEQDFVFIADFAFIDCKDVKEEVRD